MFKSWRENQAPSECQNADTVQEDTCKTLVAVGVTGAGKSTACNVIANEHFTNESGSFASATQNCEHCNFDAFGIPMRIIDTVGFLDNHLTEEQKIQKFNQFADIASFGVDCFLLVMKDGRFTEQDERCFQLFKELAGPEVCDHTIVVFTNITDKELQKKLQSNSLPDSLRATLAQIGGRAVGMESKYFAHLVRNDVLKATQQLLEVLSGRRYSNDALAVAADRRKALQLRIDALDSFDRRKVLTQMRQGLNNGSQTWVDVLKQVEEAEISEQAERQERNRLEEARQEEEQFRVAAETRETVLIEEQSRLCSCSRKARILVSSVVLALLACCSIALYLLLRPGPGPDVCDRDLCLPGSSMLGFGFDALTGKLPRQASRAVKFTFKQMKRHSNDHDNSISYLVPDQVQVIPQNRIESVATTIVTYSARQYAQSRSRGLKFDVDVPFDDKNTLSLSAEVQTANSFLQNRESYSSYSHSTVFGSLYQASLLTNHEPHQDFLQDVEGLPEQYDYAKYANFISRYGTHYLAGGYFGGYGEMAVAVNSRETQTEDSNWVERQANIHYSYLQAGAKGEDAQSEFFGQAGYYSSISTQLVGGDPQLVGQDLTKWQQWISSWWKWPSLVYKESFEVTLRGLEKLMPNGTRKENLIRAIDEYSKRNPYPDDPSCMGQVLTPQGKCCPQDHPISCNQQCYPLDTQCCSSGAVCSTSQQCCGNGCVGPDDDCCSDGGYCKQGTECCGSDGHIGCMTRGDVCCGDGSSCDAGYVCCSPADGGGCCPDGTVCRVILLPGCFPFLRGSSNATILQTSRQRYPQNITKETPLAGVSSLTS